MAILGEGDLVKDAGRREDLKLRIAMNFYLFS